MGKSVKRAPIVLTDHPKKIHWIRFTLKLCTFYIWTKKNVFSPKPMISFRSARKLSNYLLRPKMYPIDRNVRPINCNSKRCEVCINVNETSTLTSTLTGEIFAINYKFYCNARCLLTCRKYKIQYVGKAVDQFCWRWNNYKSYSKTFSRWGSCMQHLFNHFSININISLCFCFTFAYCLMACMSARTSLFLGRENLDTIIAKVCLEMPCIVGWMASFSMTRSFAAREFWTDYVCSKMSSGGGLSCRGQSVGLRWGLVDCFMYGMGFYWEFFLNRLLNCYYLHLHKLSLEDNCGLLLLRSLLFLLLLSWIL